MHIRSGSWSLALLALSLSAASLLAQPASQVSKPGDETAAGRFQALHREWTSLDKQLNDLQDRYASAAPGARGELKKQYEALVARSTEMLSQLRESAAAAYAAAPNQDPDVLRTLIGMAA